MSFHTFQKTFNEPCPKCRANGRDNRGDNAVVWPDGGKHCFSCGWHQFPKHYVAKVKENNEPKALCPIDFSKDIPAHAWSWLLQFGLPWSYWQESVGWSEKEQRLVFKLCSEGLLRFSIGRYLGSEKQRKWYVWGDSHKHCQVYGEGSTVVLVEDLISAAKVGASGFLAVPLFGVNWHPCHLHYLLGHDGPVVLWLDKDQEQQSRAKALRLGSIINKQVSVVTTDTDPKLLSFKQIGEYLNGI